MATGREVCGYKRAACGGVRARTIPSTVDKRMEPDDRPPAAAEVSVGPEPAQRRWRKDEYLCAPAR